MTDTLIKHHASGRVVPSNKGLKRLQDCKAILQGRAGKSCKESAESQDVAGVPFGSDFGLSVVGLNSRSTTYKDLSVQNPSLITTASHLAGCKPNSGILTCRLQGTKGVRV